LIEAGLRNRVIIGSDDEYEPVIESWWAKNARLRPWCVVQPHNTDEVSTALTTLLDHINGAGDWNIAVRSGGHSLAYSNNIAEGVTIDLSKMNSATYDKANNLAKIQPGGKWQDVYAELLKYNVTATGGRDGDVGVGGFLLVSLQVDEALARRLY
jgi:FAD/FMN-containing dehydrogenase